MRIEQVATYDKDKGSHDAAEDPESSFEIALLITEEGKNNFF